MANGIIDPWATNQPVAVTHSKINLHDKTGLAFTKPKPESEPSAAAAADPNAASNRRRSLNLWMDAADSEIALATVEHGVSSCTLLATDALHENLIVEKSRGETACRQGGRFIERGAARLVAAMCPLPPQPTWIDADPPIPARAASKPEKEEERPPPLRTPRPPPPPAAPPPSRRLRRRSKSTLYSGTCSSASSTMASRSTMRVGIP